MVNRPSQLSCSVSFNFLSVGVLKNWRPMSLLNCDYKIAAKAIANRLKQVLPKLIDNDQTGFVKGRSIAENIRLIDGIIKYTAENNIPGLLLFLDFEKAFDTVEWPFLQNTFRHYNFGPGHKLDSTFLS